MGEGIAYQNKDIESKVFAERLKGHSLKVYGIDIPMVKESLPTNIPQIQANELRMDNVFLLEDGVLAIIDYESDYDTGDKNKYIRYINHVAGHYEKEWHMIPEIRMIVIYTADVSRKRVDAKYNLGCLKLETETAFLSEIDGEGVSEYLEDCISEKDELSDEDVMKLIILPLTYKGKEHQRRAIDRCTDLALKIADDDTKALALSGLLVFTDKVIEEHQVDRIRRSVTMTKAGAMIAREIKESWEKGLAQGIEQGIARGKERGIESVISNALKNGNSAEEVAAFNGIPIEDVLAVEEKMLAEA